MICSGQGLALLQLSTVYLKGLLRLVLRCLFYAISPTKWLLFTDQDSVEFEGENKKLFFFPSENKEETEM